VNTYLSKVLNEFVTAHPELKLVDYEFIVEHTGCEWDVDINANFRVFFQSDFEKKLPCILNIAWIGCENSQGKFKGFNDNPIHDASMNTTVNKNGVLCSCIYMTGYWCILEPDKKPSIKPLIKFVSHDLTDELERLNKTNKFYELTLREREKYKQLDNSINKYLNVIVIVIICFVFFDSVLSFINL